MKIKHIFKSTLGDLNQETPLDKMPEIGVFTNDIREALLNNEADIAVHSLKDMESTENKKLLIGAYIRRNDFRDVIISKKIKINFKIIEIVKKHGSDFAFPTTSVYLENQNK